MFNIAEINLTTLKNNALAVRKKLNKGTKFCAVVKADAYGHGGVAVANALHGIVDCFAVALPEEGIALRQGGVSKDILTLIPVNVRDVERAVSYRLTLTVTSIADLKIIEKEGQKQNKIVKVHVKYDTGMNRQGVSTLSELKEIFEYSKRCSHVFVEGIYSHLARAENKKSVNKAVNKFLLAIRLAVGYNNKIIKHISASGGFLQGAEFDMVRIGILLYGYKPFETNAISGKPVMKIYSPIVGVRCLKKGDRMFYGEKRADKDFTAYVVRYGYADGLFRSETEGLFNNRCMDLSAMVNPVIKKGMAEIMSDAEETARKYRTISYEILTECSRRAEKVYIT